MPKGFLGHWKSLLEKPMNLNLFPVGQFALLQQGKPWAFCVTWTARGLLAVKRGPELFLFWCPQMHSQFPAAPADAASIKMKPRDFNQGASFTAGTPTYHLSNRLLIFRNYFSVRWKKKKEKNFWQTTSLLTLTQQITLSETELWCF